MTFRTGRTLIVGLHLAAFAGQAVAAPITFVDVFNPADVFLSSSNPVYGFTHDINDEGFNPVTDTLTQAVIVLDFRDDGDAQEERINFNLDGDNFGTYEVDSIPDVIFFVNVTYLQSDGLLTVTLTRRRGDVWFKKSTLAVAGDRDMGGGGAIGASTGTGAVPEPATLLLLGLGASAAGLGLARRGPKKPA